jgi:hypothetical protein
MELSSGIKQGIMLLLTLHIFGKVLISAAFPSLFLETYH